MISVVIADDQPIILRALQEFIADAPGIGVVGSAADGIAALELVRSKAPDVVLTDLDMPKMNGIELIRQVAALDVTTKCVALTTFSIMDWVAPALRAGASGYLVKDAPPEEMMQAIRDVVTDVRVLSPQIVDLLVQNVRGDAGGTAQDSERERAASKLRASIPPRELEVLELLARGMNNREIAATMFLSESSVKSYLSKLCTRLDARDRIQLVVRGIERGIVQARLE